MSREVRRVPKDWVHPKNGGEFIPLLPKFPYNAKEIAEGLAEGWLTDTPPNYGVPVMPQWAEEERTHFQMYEDTSEGTSLSPVMETPEALAKWCYENKVSSFANATASYESWLRVCKGGWAPSFVAHNGTLENGVSAMSKLDPGEK